MNTLIVGFPDYQKQATELANLLNLEYADIQVHYFPDGESKVTLPAGKLLNVEHVILFRSLDQPNAKLLELILAAQGCREYGVNQITLIAPYMAYMRQDKSFNPGEVVSQTVFGKLLATYVDAVITVDAHLHRIHALSQAIPLSIAVNLSATKPMADFLKQRFDAPLLLGPDEESRQWVEAISGSGGFDFFIANKNRYGDRQVEIHLPEMKIQGREVVLVDDIASSGNTLIKAAKQLVERNPKSLSVLVTHALFMEDSIQKLKASGVTNIWSCDSVNHATNAVFLGEILAESLTN